MNLTTQCPECGTTFPISLAQLQLRKGYIRCVNCAAIFDGYEAVVPDTTGREPSLPAQGSQQAGPQSSSANTGAGTSAPVVPAGAAQPVAEGFRISIASEPGGAQEPRFSLGDTKPLEQALAKSLSSEPVLSVRRRAAAPDDEGSGLYIEPRYPDESTLPGFLQQPSAGRRRAAGLFWGVLVLLGLILAAAQLAYIYRAQLAGLYPPARPVLERLCQPLKCTVPYARHIDHIVIMSSSLRSGSAALAAGSQPDADKAGRPLAALPADSAQGTDSISLNVVLRNTDDQPSEWPTLVLSLTDFSGTMVARKNLQPQRYLDAGLASGPFPPGSEVEITMPLQLGDLKVNGYQLDKFFK